LLVDFAKPKSLYKRAAYASFAIQNRTDICAVNGVALRKGDLASLTINCSSQQLHDLIFVKDKSASAQIAASIASMAHVRASP
jgi:hypothetical protein